jgi:cellulose biosynthesis protein BcsQ
MGIRTLVTVCIILMTPLTFAVTTVDEKNPELERAIEKLDKVNYLPLLMPVIVKNRDFIGLTQEQMDEINEWRQTNKAPMIDAMQKIVSKRIAIQQAALSPTISSSRLIQMQNEIFQLQREVLEYKLSCREQIMKTFNEENWISFFMVLAEEDMGITVPLSYAGK